jgi:hypothetical protein
LPTRLDVPPGSWRMGTHAGARRYPVILGSANGTRSRIGSRVVPPDPSRTPLEGVHDAPTHVSTHYPVNSGTPRTG